MCLMTEKETPYTDGEIEEENMLTEVFNESDRLYSPFTVGKENKSTVTDDILLSDIGGYPDQQNKTVALQLQRIPTQFSSELPEDYSLLNKWKQERDVEHMSDLENRKSERNNEKSTNKDTIEILQDRLRDALIMKRNILLNMIRAELERETSKRILKAEFELETSERILKAEFELNTSERILKAGLERETSKRILKAELEQSIERILKAELEQASERILKEKEKKEYIRQLFVMLSLIILIQNICENIKCKQSSCRKYPCLNSILYLLWQSGDVEVNPGPANSTTYRNWLYDVCPIVRKAIAGIPAECKMYNIWKKKPEKWPQGELYFDPRNTKGLTVNKVEDFLQILIHCCDDTSKLSHEIISEIDTWNSHRNKDNDQLLYLFRTRMCLKSIEQVNRSLKVLQSHLLADEDLTVEVNTFIRILLSCQPATDQQCIVHKIYKAEAIRKIVTFLWKILSGNDKNWTKKPEWWPLDVSFYNPNNGGKRCAKNEDALLLETMITRCEQKSIILQKPYQDMVEALRADDHMLLSNLMTRHTAENDLKKAVMELHEEGLLQDSWVAKHLKELGLLVQCDGRIQNAKSQKRKMVNTMKKHETKKTKQRDHEDAVDTTLKELLPDCSIGQLLDNQSESFLLDTIGQNIPDFLGDEAEDI